MKVGTTRLETFSDGVFAIVITIMVLALKLPVFDTHSTTFSVLRDLKQLLPYFTAYAFSFLMVAIFWSNHHYMFHLLEKADEHLQWMNFIYLFFVSLIPFATALAGSNPYLPITPAAYSLVMFLASGMFLLMRDYSIRKQLLHTDDNRDLSRKVFTVSIKGRTKSLIGTLIYLIAIPLAFVHVYAAYVCIMIPPVIFFIPDGIDNEILAEKISVKNG